MASATQIEPSSSPPAADPDGQPGQHLLLLVDVRHDVVGGLQPLEHSGLAQPAEEPLGHPPAEDHLAPCLVDRQVGAGVGEHVGLRVLDRDGAADDRGDGVGQREQVTHRHAVDLRAGRHRRPASDPQEGVEVSPGDGRRRRQQGDAGPRRGVDQLRPGLAAEFEDDGRGTARPGLLDQPDSFPRAGGDADAEHDVSRLHAVGVELVEQRRDADLDVEPARCGHHRQDLLAQVGECRSRACGDSRRRCVRSWRHRSGASRRWTGVRRTSRPG